MHFKRRNIFLLHDAWPYQLFSQHNVKSTFWKIPCHNIAQVRSKIQFIFFDCIALLLKVNWTTFYALGSVNTGCVFEVQTLILSLSF